MLAGWGIGEEGGRPRKARKSKAGWYVEDDADVSDGGHGREGHADEWEVGALPPEAWSEGEVDRLAEMAERL